MVAWRRQERLSDKPVMLIAPQSSSCDRHTKPHNTVGDVDNNWTTVTETQHAAVLAILGWSRVPSRSSGLRMRAMRNVDLVSGFDALLNFVLPQSWACQSGNRGYTASVTSKREIFRWEEPLVRPSCLSLSERMQCLDVRGNKYSDLGQQRGEEHQGH